MIFYIYGWHKLEGWIAYLQHGTHWKLAQEVAERHFPAPLASAVAAPAVQLIHALFEPTLHKTQNDIPKRRAMPRSVLPNITTSRADLSGDAVEEISSNLRRLLADVFALYLKTKNFHWHISGRHFMRLHLLLDEQSTQIFAMTDDIAERARKIGETTIRSISDIARNQRLKDNDKEAVSPQEMIRELCEDNQQLTRSLRSMHKICDRHNDVATASVIENWIDESERRTRLLSEIVRDLYDPVLFRCSGLNSVH
jgi:starvation-inducible DNA-binding protein